MDAVIALAVLLGAARLGEWLAVRIGFQHAVGQIAAGVGLAALLPHLGSQAGSIAASLDSVRFHDAISVAILFVMLLAGIEIRPAAIVKNSGKAAIIALGGGVVPFLFGAIAVFALFPQSPDRIALAAVAGLALTITAIPATVAILEEFGLLQKPLGVMLVAAALFDDILGLFAMALVLGIIAGEGAQTVQAAPLLLFKVIVFFALVVTFGRHLYPRLRGRLQAIDVAAAELSALVLAAVAIAALAEFLGLHWILGAFLAGLFFEPEQVGRQAYEDTKRVITVLEKAVFAPLFFASIGFGASLGAVAAAPGLLVLIIAIAIFGKLVGAGGAARLAGLSRRDSVLVGIGMGARGAVELVVLDIARKAGIFAGAEGLYAALVLTALLTTALAPVLLRLSLKA